MTDIVFSISGPLGMTEDKDETHMQENNTIWNEHLQQATYLLFYCEIGPPKKTLEN